MSFQSEFDACFRKYKEDTIAIYGTGKIAQTVLEKVNGYRFSCVIDPKYTGCIWQNMPVVSITTAIKQANVILIAASEESKKLIFQRIKSQISEDVMVLDMQGNHLNALFADLKNNHPYWKLTERDLYRMIDENDVISFDIFDTLLMRRVTYPEDVFAIIEREMKKEGMDIPFAEWRIKAEKVLQERKEPDIDDIYFEIKKRYKLSNETVQILKTRELEWEKKVLFPRGIMVDVFEYAKSNNKLICLTSDMYLKKDYIEVLLHQWGITGYYDIYVSCECGVGKKDGLLYKVLMKDFPDKTLRFVHIGDNWETDFHQARKIGMSSFWIMSAREMLSASSFCHILNYANTLDDRIFLGEFMSIAFNNPFALQKGKGKIYFSGVDLLSKTCFSLFFMYFMIWIFSRIEKENKAILLFGSRDTYFIHRMYKKFSTENMPKGVYFYSSRKAMRSTTLCCESEIINFVNHLATLPQSENLKVYIRELFDVDLPRQFDISVGDAIKLWGKNALIQELKMFASSLITASKKKKETYFKYIMTLGIGEYHKVFFIDMQSTGATQYFMKKLLKKDVILLTAISPRDVDTSWVKSLYRIYPMSSAKPVIDFLEIVYASHEGQLDGFDEDGYPLFNNDTRYNSELLDEIQTGVEDFINHYLIHDWIKCDFSKELPIAFLELLLPQYSIINENMVKLFDVYDPLDTPNHSNYMEEIIRKENI